MRPDLESAPSALLTASSPAFVPEQGMPDSMQGTLNMLIRELGMMRSAVTGLTNKITECLNRIGELERENFQLRTENAQKDELIEELKLKVDDAEQATRENNVLISGTEVKVDCANLHDSASRLLSDMLQMNIEKTTLFSYKKLSNEANSNAILINVPNQVDRAALFSAARTRKPEIFYVSEFLTPTRSKVLYELRNLRRAKLIYSAFSFHGRIYYKKTENADKTLVKSMKSIQGLINRAKSIQSRPTSS